MSFAAVDIAAAVLGLVVLAGFAWRLFQQVKTLGKQVGAAADRIGEAQRKLDVLNSERDSNRAGNRTGTPAASYTD